FDHVAVLVAVVAVGVVGRLDGFGADLLIFKREDGFIAAYHVLLFQDSLKCPVHPVVISFEKFDKAVHQLAQFYKAAVDLSLAAAIYHLVSFFTPDAFNHGKHLFAKSLFNANLLSFSDNEAEGLVNQLVSRAPGDVAADQLTIHAYLLAAFLELQYLIPGHLGLALFLQVS